MGRHQAVTPQSCLYALLYAPRDHHEEILRDLVTPVTRAIRSHPDLDSLFFARFNLPSWQVRFRILGRPSWVDGEVAELVRSRLFPVKERGLLERHEFASYQREYERYGGEEGMELAERIFLHDSLACLDLMEAESQGRLAKSRREWSLLLTERFLDLMEFDRTARIAFYRHGYRWTLDMESWSGDDFAVLEKRYRSLRPGLEELFSTPVDAPEAWGGEAPARIALAYLDSVRPAVKDLLAAHSAGRIRNDLVSLAWSYTHMQCNRLGIDPAPEAILRFFMHRFLEEGPGPAA